MSSRDSGNGNGNGNSNGNGNKRDMVPKLTDAELVQLRIRVIALENLVIVLLAELSDGQLARACDMASYISPRPGFTPHPLTLHAAGQMVHLIQRSDHFRSITPDQATHRDRE